MGPAVDIEMPLLLSRDEAAQGCERPAIFFRRDQECAACAGKGSAQGRACAPCDGTGATFLPHRLRLTLPPGLADRHLVRVRGQGNAAARGRSWGDLFFVCYVRPVPRDRPEIAPPAETGRQALAEAKAAAKEAMRRRDAAAAVQRRSAPPVEALWDAEAHALLGIACANLGEKDRAATHLYTALEEEPNNSLHHFNAGFFEAALGNRLQACVCYEAALRRSPSYRQAREALPQALAGLWTTPHLPELLQTDPRELQEIQRAMLARHYAQAASLCARLHLPGLTAEEQNGLRFLWGCAHLLACCSGQGDGIEQAAALFDLCARSAPLREAARQGLDALERWAHRDGDLDGLLALARYQTAAHNSIGAGRSLARAVEYARNYTPPQASVAIVDPLIQAKQTSIHRRLEALRAAVQALPRSQGGDSSWLAGLTDLTEAYIQVAVAGRIDPGWPFAVRAVQSLEAAFAPSPTDTTRRDLFFQAVDYMNHLADAMLKQVDTQLQLLLQTTRDTLRSELLPSMPLRALLRTEQTRRELHALLTAAGKSLLVTAFEALRGEFIVAARAGQYVLTNYRLLLITESESPPHLLPLAAIQKYSPRPESIHTSTLVIGYRDGRQLALNRVANKSFPPADLIETLLAARMWEALPPEEPNGPAAVSLPREQVGGLPHSAALPSGAAEAHAGGAAGSPARSADAACRRCGRLRGAHDVFCRQCGAALNHDIPSPQPGE